MQVFVGCFSRHWRHVMHRESYEDGHSALILDEQHLPVKVHRELQTALDERPMTFVVAAPGRGSWPLNVFLTPYG